MPYLREVRSLLFCAWDDGDLDDDEFMLLYDINKSRNDYPYWRFERFDLDKLDDAEAWTSFRFFKNDVYRLQDVLEIPDEFQTYNRLVVDGTEALCMLLFTFVRVCC